MWKYGYRKWVAEDSSDDPCFVPVDHDFGVAVTKAKAWSGFFHHVQDETTRQEINGYMWNNEVMDEYFTDDAGNEYYLVQI